MQPRERERETGERERETGERGRETGDQRARAVKWAKGMSEREREVW
jgi:hypothetical protein